MCAKNWLQKNCTTIRRYDCNFLVIQWKVRPILTVENKQKHQPHTHHVSGTINLAIRQQILLNALSLSFFFSFTFGQQINKPNQLILWQIGILKSNKPEHWAIYKRFLREKKNSRFCGMAMLKSFINFTDIPGFYLSVTFTFPKLI